MKVKKLLLATVAICVAGIGLYSLLPHTAPAYPRTWNEIRESGILRVVTEYNMTGYHADGDSVAGFQYELAQAFARTYGLKQEVHPEMTLTQQMNGICNGSYDLIAHSLLVTSENKDSILLFSQPIWVNKQVLVQRREEPDDTLHRYVHNLFELAGKTLYVTEGSPAIYRIRNLSEEMGDSIYVKTLTRYGAEQLMILVAHGDIDYAVCEANTARSLLRELPQLDIRQEISFNQFYAWAVHCSNDELLRHINEWLEQYRQTDDFKALLKKYRLE